jgi:type VI protein secretion system component VasK
LRKGDLGPALESELRQALETVREQMRWAEQRLEEQNKLTEDAAREALEKISKLEQDLAERARRLLGEEGLEEGLPGESIERLERAQEMMQEATRRLAEAKGQDGLQLQRDAQRLLEQARPGRTGEENERAQDGDERDGGRKPSTGGDVPNPDKGNKAEEFRRRVLDGLKEGEGGRLAPAIQRYAEGLLQ